ncbi:MAG: 16S rRNA (uracil(1498)-N(3))-methyltransferase [Blastocatellia bacterium]
MQVHRFFASPEVIDNGTIRLTAEESHHLARVLRLREGEMVSAFDGLGNEWECEIAAIHKSECRLSILKKLETVVESPLRLTLAQALVKGEKFDLVVQKATELGVSRILPVITEHCEIRISEERSEQRLQRWQRISLGAIKQSGRRRLVEIDQPVKFQQFCRDLQGEPALIFSEKTGSEKTGSEKTGRGLPPLAAQDSGLTVVIGPEGGWSDGELDLATSLGLIPVHLGPRILRTETAAITAVTLAQYHYGDLARF